MRDRLVVGNWKMHTSLADAVVLATRVRDGMDQVSSDVTVVLCPPTVWLYPVAEILERSADHLQLGAQNIWPGREGRFTGETSAWMLAQMCQFALIGHSERRVHHDEDGQTINQKVKAALRFGIRPILCVGEFRRLTSDARGQLKPRRGDRASDIFLQLRNGLADLGAAEVAQVVIAYEPVWAISGSSGGQTAELHYTAQVVEQLRAAIDGYVGSRVAARIPILYGGSVSARTAEQFAHLDGIDGVLVGAESLKANEFLQIAATFHARAKRS